MITFMLNIAVDPVRHDVVPHTSAQYEIRSRECDHCHNGRYLHVPGNVHHFETKEQMIEQLTKYAGKLWDKAEGAKEYHV